MNEKCLPPQDERGDFEKLFPLFSELLNEIRDHNISKFLEFFLVDDTDMLQKFFTAPGARTENPGHHAFVGGLAYHTLTAAKLAGEITDHYRSLGMNVNRDLVVAGVILHDVGKADCYEWQDERRIEHYHGKDVEVEAGYTHTKKSKLFHHIPHGFQLFMRAADSFNLLYKAGKIKHNLTEKKIEKLGHIILSHHGRRSWSSPVIPNFIEAYIVHAVEMMDAYVDKYNKGIDVRDIYDH